MTDSCESRIDESLETAIKDIEELISKDDLQEFFEYGLCFDFVEEGTFEDQTEAYWRYQLSYGGPSDEFRFFGNGRIQYWFLDWYDGAHRNLTGGDLGTMEQVLEIFIG